MRKKPTGLRFTEEMLAQLTAKAKDMGLTVSDIVRMAVNEYFKKER